MTECRPPEGTPSGTWHWLRWRGKDWPCRWQPDHLGVWCWVLPGQSEPFALNELVKWGYTYLGPVQPYAPQDGAEAMREAAAKVLDNQAARYLDQSGRYARESMPGLARDAAVASKALRDEVIAIRALPLPSTEDPTHAR